MNETIAFDPQEYQNMVFSTVQQAFKSHAPSWLESLVTYIQMHPWISIGVVFIVILVISAIVREVLCHYLKTNEILRRLKALEEKIKKD